MMGYPIAMRAASLSDDPFGSLEVEVSVDTLIVKLKLIY